MSMQPEPAHLPGSSRSPEVEFILPHGYIDAAGTVHRRGRMRMATALDEIEAVGHPRVQANEAYLPVILLSRVVTQLGSLPYVTSQVMEGLFAADMAYLEDLYLQINDYDGMVIEATCPQCSAELHLKIAPLSTESPPDVPTHSPGD